MDKTMRHSRLSTPLSIHELRLKQGITVKAASELSGIAIDRIKRWERKGTSKVNVYDVWELLNAYHSNLESCDFKRIATQRQVLEAILSGACTAMASGRIQVDMDRVVSLMGQEGFNTSDLEAVLDQDKTKGSTAAVTA
jgi:transcriptional regulator with XRE-family HTH domain